MQNVNVTPTPAKEHPMSNVTIASASANLRAVCANLKARFKGRDEAIDLMAASVIAGEFMLFLGSRGEAKTALVQAFANAITDGEHFYVGLSQTSTIDDVLGGIDVPLYTKTGEYKRMTKGKLATCTTFAKDEIFKCAGQVLNGTLTPLSERMFEGVPMPVLWGAGMSNELPPELRGAKNGVPLPLSRGEESLLPFMDRFFYCVEVKPLAKGSADWCEVVFGNSAAADDGSRVSVEELRFLQREAKRVTWSPSATQAFIDLAVALDDGTHGDRVEVSTRRWVKARGVVQAHALLRGSSVCKPKDCKMLSFGLWTTPDQKTAIERAITATQPSGSEEISLTVAKIKGLHAAFKSKTLVLDENGKLSTTKSPVAANAPQYTSAGIALSTSIGKELRNLKNLALNADDDEDRAEAQAALDTLYKWGEEVDALTHAATKGR